MSLIRRWKESELRKKWVEFSLSYLIIDPGVNTKNKKSRQNWILFMANKTGKYPVRKINERFLSSISIATLNTDFQELEGEGLIKRTKEGRFAFVVPLFEDSGEIIETKKIQYRNMALNFGLPLITILLIFVFIMIIK
mgnify:CR=1 FL=1